MKIHSLLKTVVEFPTEQYVFHRFGFPGIVYETDEILLYRTKKIYKTIHENHTRLRKSGFCGAAG